MKNNLYNWNHEITESKHLMLNGVPFLPRINIALRFKRKFWDVKQVGDSSEVLKPSYYIITYTNAYACLQAKKRTCFPYFIALIFVLF